MRPFLALRSYLPADHPDKAKEMGSEATPGAFIDTLLDLTEEARRVLAPHGSLCVELGDTYAGSGGGGGDYNANGLRDGQERFDGSASRTRSDGNGKVFRGGERQRDKRNGKLADYSDARGNPDGMRDTTFSGANTRTGGGHGWPLDKSLCLIPELYRIALVYGFNPLTGRETPRWRARNVVRWVRPNPPVGALADKFRNATSEMVVACTGRKRYFDLDAVRVPFTGHGGAGTGVRKGQGGAKSEDNRPNDFPTMMNTHAGAPPLDWWLIPTTDDDEGGTLYTASRDCPEHSLPAIRHRLRRASDGELREALRRNSRRTDIHPALAQLCERSASSDLGSPDARLAMKDWLDRAIHAERTAESTPGDRTPSLMSSDDERGGSAGTQSRTSRMSDRPDTPDDTTAKSALECESVATARSNADHRRDLVPETIPAGTPSAETADSTADTSTSPGLFGPHLDMPESSTSEAWRSAGEPQKPPRISGKSARCSCTEYSGPDYGHYASWPLDWWKIPTEPVRLSHYATFPRALCVRPIEAMCPRRVCTSCGKPSERIVTPGPAGPVVRGYVGDKRRVTMDGGPLGPYAPRPAETLGWTDCGHNSWRPGLVLDPFAGSGTTLAVASGHGRASIGVDLDARNADLARERVGMWLEVEYAERTPA